MHPWLSKLVEVPAKVKVVEGKEQLIPVIQLKTTRRDSITQVIIRGSTFDTSSDGQKNHLIQQLVINQQ